MKIYILGVCGTFMAGIAKLARELGHDVIGSDANVYPPMSTQLEDLGIALLKGYDTVHLDEKPDVVIVGNVIARENVEIERVLNEKIPYISGPQWLYENVLKDYHVLAVAGTHGKTTTASMLTWLLEQAGFNPGFLIGGVPENFKCSARLTKSKYFVIEADEYDTAFFDKRSKFIHYHPQTLILNNLEFDHADIFNDLGAIKKQFHYLVRTVPANGEIVVNARDKNLMDVLEIGCWTTRVNFNDAEKWHAENVNDGSKFEVYDEGDLKGQVTWELLGQHNVENGLAAIVAANSVGIKVSDAIQALTTFKNVKRRLEIKSVGDITIYDDFAHHPTAIKTTLAGLRAKIGSKQRIIAIVELGSHTMKMGVHQNALIPALSDADIVFIKQPESAKWDASVVAANSPIPVTIYQDDELLLKKLKEIARAGDHVIVMSNTGFNRIVERL